MSGNLCVYTMSFVSFQELIQEILSSNDISLGRPRRAVIKSRQSQVEHPIGTFLIFSTDFGGQLLLCSLQFTLTELEGSLELPATTLQIAWSSAGLVLTGLLSYRSKVWKYENIIAVNHALLVHLGSSVQDDQMLLKMCCFDCNSQIMESKAKSRFMHPTVKF